MNIPVQNKYYIFSIVRLSFLLFCLFFVLSNIVYAEKRIAVFNVMNRDANEIVDNIQAFVPQDTTIRVDQNKIIIKVDEQYINELKELIASLDIAKKQLKIEAYWGDSPEDFNDDIVISTNREKHNQTKTLYVEDGESVVLTENNIISLTKTVSGAEDSLAKTEYDWSKANPTELANVTKDLAEKNQELNKLSTELKEIEEQIRDDRNAGNDIAALEARLTAKETEIFDKNKEILGLQEKQKILTADSTKEVKEQSDYNSASGVIMQEHLILPETIYIKPIVLNNKDLKVEINISKINKSSNNNSLSNIQAKSQQIKTTKKIKLNKWQQIYGKDTASEINTRDTYSTRNNQEDRKIWVRIGVVE